MKSKFLMRPWVIIVVALLLVAVILVLADRYFTAAVGLSILSILLGALYALAISSRIGKFLEREVEVKTKELEESQERLQTAFEDLKKAHAFQQSIIDGVAEPILVIGADYWVKLMNQAARRFSFGVVGASKPVFCYQVSHQQEAPCKELEHPCPMEQVRESGQTVTVVHEHYHANGERRFVELVAAPLWGADGTFQGIVESARDITQRKLAEEMAAERLQVLTRSHDELEQFSYTVAKSIRDFFEKLPSDE